LTIATGGVSAVLGVLTAVAGAASGVTGGINSSLRLENEKRQGEVLEFRELRSLNLEQVHTLISEIQMGLQKDHELQSLAIQLLRNSRVRN
jgi:hypothetical protein